MSFTKTCRAFLVLALSFSCLLPFDARAIQAVTSEDLYRDIQKQSEQREQDLATVEGFISLAPVRQLIEQKVDFGKVMQALPQLDDQELAELASQVRTTQASFAAGYHDDTIRLLIIVLLVVAIVVLIVSVAD